MNELKSNSGRDVVFRDFSTSGTAEISFDSSVMPSSRVGFSWNRVIFNRQFIINPIVENPRIEFVKSDLNDLSDAERIIYLENIKNNAEEPEDELLAKSDLLPRLISREINEPPLENWERYLEEL